IVGSYSVLSEARFLNARLVDVETGETERSAIEKNVTPSRADQSAARVVRRLFGLAVSENKSAETPEKAGSSPVSYSSTPPEWTLEAWSTTDNGEVMFRAFRKQK